MSRLCERFESFIQTIDGFENIDALLRGANLHGRKRADYLVQNRNVIVEQKVLTSNPVLRPQKFVDKLARERNFVFYGTVSTERIFSSQPDPTNLQRRMILDMARAIDDNVAYADKQTSEIRELFKIPEAVGILVLLNENARVLRPDVIHYALANCFQKKSGGGQLRYPANDGVLLISEAHSIAIPNSIVLFLFRFT